MPNDLNDCLMKHLTSSPSQRRLNGLKRLLYAAACMIIVVSIGFVFVMKQSQTDTKVVAKLEQPKIEPKIEPKLQVEKVPVAEEVPVVAQAKPRPKMKHRVAQTVIVEATTQHEEMPEVIEDKPLAEETTSQEQTEEPLVIPPDRQALADIFLAEEDLQVAYELQAQQEAIRAYAASLEGIELPKPIIAF